MKKVWKAGISGLAALSLGLAGFGAVAGAAYADVVTTGSITITDTAATERAYTAYQIFAASGYDEATETLSNVSWGTGITTKGQADFIAAVRVQIENFNKTAADNAKLSLSENPTPAAVAKAISDLHLTDNSAGAKALANVFKTEGTLDKNAGTGLTKDGNDYKAENIATGYYLIQDETDTLGNDEAYSSFLLQVVGDAEATAKSTVPTVSKEVEDEKDTEAGNSFGASADHDINETFQFKLIANIPANANRADYDSYMVRFNDTMSDGVTFEKINSVIVTGTDTDNAAATITVTDYALKGNDGNDLTGTQKGGKFTLEIADLLALRTAGDKGLDITKAIDITVLYDAHLNEDAKIFTTGSDPTKDVNTNEVYLTYSNNPNADGTGDTAPQKVYVYSFDMDATKVDKKDETVTLAGAQFELYTDEAMTNQVILAQDATGAYYPAAKGASADDNVTIVTPASGKFTIKGLDNATYYLKETKAPEGYNLPTAPFAFTVVATHSVTEGVPTASLTNGKVNIKLENSNSSTLPSTGGMGTTILYTVGGAIVLMAGIGLAVALRRRQA